MLACWLLQHMSRLFSDYSNTSTIFQNSCRFGIQFAQKIEISTHYELSEQPNSSYPLSKRSSNTISKSYRAIPAAENRLWKKLPCAKTDKVSAQVWNREIVCRKNPAIDPVSSD